MLEKIESAYLAVMRVVVLVAATVALIVCIVGATLAGPGTLRQLGFVTGPRPVEGADLASFVQEQKSTPAPADGTSSDTSTPVEIMPGKIAKAARDIVDYAHTRSGADVDLGQLQTALKSKRDALDAEYQSPYEDSLVVLAQDLKVSKGKALSWDRVAQLIDWHYERFSASTEEQKLDRLAQAAKASAGMMLAAGGLVAFILILFFFLFVKIERNLRIVRTHEVGTVS